jgi:hypothetical protein
MKEKISGIYCIECIVDNKKYIGRSNDIFGRFSVHKKFLRRGSHWNSYLQYSFNKHGEDNFKFWIVQNCDVNILPDMEIYWVEYFDAYIRNGGGFNMTRGGETPPDNTGFHHTEESKQKISDATRGENNPNFGKLMPEETKKKLYDANKGRKFSEEHKRKLSEARIGENNPNFGKPMSEEQKNKISISKIGKNTGEDAPFYNRHHTEESKKIMSDLAKGRKLSEESKQKISKFNKGKVLSEETKSKMSLAAKGKPKSEEAKKNMSIAQRKSRYMKKLGVPKDYFDDMT